MTALFGDPDIVKGDGFTIKRSDLDQVVSSAKANYAAQGQQLLKPRFRSRSSGAIDQHPPVAAKSDGRRRPGCGQKVLWLQYAAWLNGSGRKRLFKGNCWLWE